MSRGFKRSRESEEALRIEILTLFLHNICTLVQTYSIPDELIKNVNQTPSEYVPISSVTMAEKNHYQLQNFLKAFY